MKRTMIVAVLALLMTSGAAMAETVIKEDFRCLHHGTLVLLDQAQTADFNFIGNQFKSGECTEALKIGTSVRVDQRFEYPLNGKTDVCIVPTGSSELCQWVSSEVIK